MRKIIYFILFLHSPMMSQIDSIGTIRVFLINNDFENAIEYAENLSKIKPNDIEIMKLKGEAYKMKGDLKMAKSIFSKGFLFDSTDASIAYQLAIIYENEANFADASIWYEKAIRNRNSPLYYLKAGKNAVILKNPKLAKEYFRRGFEKNKLLLLNDYCRLLIEESDFYTVDTILNTMLNKDSINNKLLTLRATSNYRQNCLHDVLNDLKLLEENGDTSIFTRRLFGYTYFNLSSWDNSLKYFNYLLYQDTSRLENTHYYMAISNYKINNYEKSIYHYNEAIKAGTSSELGVYYQNKGEIYQLLGDKQAAIHSFELANEYYPDGKNLFYLAQNAELFEKDKKKSLDLYKKYLATNDKTFKTSAQDRVDYLEKNLK